MLEGYIGTGFFAPSTSFCTASSGLVGGFVLVFLQKKEGSRSRERFLSKGRSNVGGTDSVSATEQQYVPKKLGDFKNHKIKVYLSLCM